MFADDLVRQGEDQGVMGPGLYIEDAVVDVRAEQLGRGHFIFIVVIDRVLAVVVLVRRLIDLAGDRKSVV